MEYSYHISLFISFFTAYKLFTCCKRRLKKLNIQGKHVLITGGGSGLGKEIAHECYYKGAYITLIGRTKSSLLETFQSLEPRSNNSQYGKFVQFFDTDLSKNDSFAEILKKAESRFGSIDLFIACAGTCPEGFFLESKAKDYIEAIENNYLTLVNSLLPVSKLMCGRKKGRICVVSSGNCYRPLIGSSALSASKAAVHALADSIRPELERYNVNLSIFSPGPIQTKGYECKKNKDLMGLDFCPITAEQACTELLRGVAVNDKYITTNQIYRIIRVSSLGSADRQNSLIDILLSMISVFIGCVVAKYGRFRDNSITIKISN